MKTDYEILEVVYNVKFETPLGDILKNKSKIQKKNKTMQGWAYSKLTYSVDSFNLKI